MTTKREFLLNIYKKLQDDITPLELDVKAVFPDIEKLNLPELVLHYKTYFNNENQWETNLKLLFELNNISFNDTEFKIIYPMVKEFLQNFGKIL